MEKWAKLQDVKAGDVLVADGGFDCMRAGPHVVHKDPERDGAGALYIECAEGQHFIDGQADDGVHMIGLTIPASAGNSVNKG